MANVTLTSNKNFITFVSTDSFKLIAHTDSYKNQIYRYLGFKLTDSIFTGFATTHTGSMKSNLSLTTAINIRFLEPNLHQDE